MKVAATVTIKAIVRKISQMENVYHEITVMEKVQPKDDNNEVLERDWNKLYYPENIDTNVKEDLIGKEVEMIINFYPVKRQVGDQVFTNINCHVEEIKGI